jgi:pyruvate formate lyase activating enzyme
MSDMARAAVVECLLCEKRCRLRQGERGDCRVRLNIDGKLQTLVYGKPCAVHVDPIEKKPIFHMLPGSGAFSIATAGCNLHCKYCQNWEISQREPEETSNVDLSPVEVVQATVRRNCRSIAYTYSEPVVFYEYVLDTATLARNAGIKNILVTAGFIEEDPWRRLAPVVDAVNVDLKGFTEDYYERVCAGSLAPVLRMLEVSREEGIWVEITNLVVPTLNDDAGEIARMCRWIVDRLGDEVPLHFSRFYPTYRLENLPPTPVETLDMARDAALREGIKYVYVGNVPGHPGNNTHCPGHGGIVIERRGYAVIKNLIENGRCTICGEEIPGVWV